MGGVRGREAWVGGYGDVCTVTDKTAPDMQTDPAADPVPMPETPGIDEGGDAALPPGEQTQAETPEPEQGADIPPVENPAPEVTDGAAAEPDRQAGPDKEADPSPPAPELEKKGRGGKPPKTEKTDPPAKPPKAEKPPKTPKKEKGRVRPAHHSGGNNHNKPTQMSAAPNVADGGRTGETAREAG